MNALALTPRALDAIAQPVTQPSAPRDLTAESDDALMGLAGAGLTAAFTELTRRYERRVRRFCSCLLSDPSQAAEAAQETFLKAWMLRQRYRPRGQFRELLFAIARNECRARKRRAWVRRVLGLRLEPIDEQAPSSEVIVLESERDARVRAALRELPEKFAVPLTLRFVEGLDYAAIAATIGRSESAARSRIHYGLKELARRLPEAFS